MIFYMLVVSFSTSGRDILILESIWFDKNLCIQHESSLFLVHSPGTEKLYVLYMQYAH